MHITTAPNMHINYCSYDKRTTWEKGDGITHSQQSPFKTCAPIDIWVRRLGSVIPYMSYSVINLFLSLVRVSTISRGWLGTVPCYAVTCAHFLSFSSVLLKSNNLLKKSYSKKFNFVGFNMPKLHQGTEVCRSGFGDELTCTELIRVFLFLACEKHPLRPQDRLW